VDENEQGKQAGKPYRSPILSDRSVPSPCDSEPRKLSKGAERSIPTVTSPPQSISLSSGPGLIIGTLGRFCCDSRSMQVDKNRMLIVSRLDESRRAGGFVTLN